MVAKEKIMNAVEVVFLAVIFIAFLIAVFMELGI
jgi:hypothetical protein